MILYSQASSSFSFHPAIDHRKKKGKKEKGTGIDIALRGRDSRVYFLLLRKCHSQKLSNLYFYKILCNQVVNILSGGSYS